jgi:hypothetical protein
MTEQQDSEQITCWHVTPAGNVRGILKNGLQPRIGPRSKSVGEDRPLIYVFSSERELESAIRGWLGVAYRRGTTLSIIEMTIPLDWLGWSERRDIFENILERPVPPSMIRLVAADASEWIRNRLRAP